MAIGENEFGGKNVVVTGGMQGLGEAIADRLLAEGCYVNIVDKASPEESSKWSNMSECHYYECDITSKRHLKNISRDILDNIGPVDILINNAGIVKVALFQDQLEEDWEELVKTNVIGTFNSTSVFGRSMVKKKRGCIVNVSSTDARVGRIGHDTQKDGRVASYYKDNGFDMIGQLRSNRQDGRPAPYERRAVHRSGYHRQTALNR